jgi:hypothetical protein
MNTDPRQIRSQVDALLADFPQIDPGVTDHVETPDVDALGRRLEEAHQLLVDALESVEKG